MLRVIHIAVGGKDAPASQLQQHIIRHHRELQHHLVHRRLAVPPHGGDMVPVLIKHLHALLRVVALRQRVPRPVVQKIAQQQKPVRLFPLKSIQHTAAGSGAAVDIRRNQPSHTPSFSRAASFTQMQKMAIACCSSSTGGSEGAMRMLLSRGSSP